MNEKNLIENYYVSEWAFKQSYEQLEKHFVGLAKKAIKEGNGQEVLDIMSRCPDSKIEDKIAELFNNS